MLIYLNLKPCLGVDIGLGWNQDGLEASPLSFDKRVAIEKLTTTSS